MSSGRSTSRDTLHHASGARAARSHVLAEAVHATRPASAGTYGQSAHAVRSGRSAAPVVLRCGTAFDVVSAPAEFGRRVLGRLRDDGPGCGPVAVHGGRVLLFAAPGTAQRLPALLRWEEWGTREAVPALLCHGSGDAVTVPPLAPGPASAGPTSHWLVAPDAGGPWLPGPEVLLWACVRAVRSALDSAARISIFPGADQGARVYDVGRRR